MLLDDGMSSRSSLIGVAISLSGNVLISLALNCQKLAHIRLQQQEEGVEQSGDDQDGSERRGLLSERPEDNGYGATDSSTRETGLSSPSSTSSGQKHNDRLHESQDIEAGHNDNAQSQEQGNKQDSGNGSRWKMNFLKSRLWWLGIGLMTLGEFGNFLSYGFAPASLVAPLGAVALLANVIFSPILLKERFQLSDLGGILLAIIGAVTVVFSSKQSDASLSPDQLWEAIRRVDFIAYALTSMGLVALLAWGSSTRFGDRYILLDVGVCALFGGFTVLSTKGLSSLVSQMGPFELLRFPISYALIAVLVGTALAQITYLNRALQRFDSREVIPTQFVMFTISAIVGSAILYQEFKDTDVHQLINFLFGCATTFLGVFLLTKNRKADDDDEDGDEDYEGYHVDEHAQGIDDADSTQHSGIEAHLTPHTPSQGARSAKAGMLPLSAQRRRTFGGASGPILAAVPVSVPGGRRAVGTSLGPSARRLRYQSANSGASVPTVSMRRGTDAGQAGSPRGQAGPSTTAAMPSSVPAIASTSYNEVRSMPVLYTRRSIFNPAFSITYATPPPLSTRHTDTSMGLSSSAARAPVLIEETSAETSPAREHLTAAAARLDEDADRSTDQ